MFGEGGYLKKNLLNFLKACEDHEAEVWSAEEFMCKLAGLLAGNTKGLIYLDSKVKFKGEPALAEFIPHF